MKELVFCLVVVLLCVGVIGIKDSDVACCPKGQGLLGTKCWDFGATRSSPTLKCFENEQMYRLYDSMGGLEINDDAQLLLLLKNRVVIYQPHTFCFGKKVGLNDTSPSEGRRVALVCFKNEEKSIDSRIKSYCIAVSALFLIITAVVHATQKKYRTVHGLSVMFLCGCLGVGLAILSGMNLVPYTDMTLCAVRGFLTYFFILAGFFWMNVVSMQLLSKLKKDPNTSSPIKVARTNHRSIICCSADGASTMYPNARSSRGNASLHSTESLLRMSEQEQSCDQQAEHRQNGLIKYSMYAWGCPIVLTIITAIVNFYPGGHMKPGIGLNHCWFFDDKQKWIYMYSVMAVLIMINVFLYFTSMILLWGTRKELDLSTKVLMTLRLFMLMGVPWVTEVLSSVAPHHIAWELWDLVNSLYGVFIFLILVVAEISCNRYAHRYLGPNIVQSRPYDKFGTPGSPLPYEKFGTPGTP